MGCWNNGANTRYFNIPALHFLLDHFLRAEVPQLRPAQA